MTLCGPLLLTVDVSLRSEGSGHLFPTLSHLPVVQALLALMLESARASPGPRSPGPTLLSLRQVFPLLGPRLKSRLSDPVHTPPLPLLLLPQNGQ